MTRRSRPSASNRTCPTSRWPTWPARPTGPGATRRRWPYARSERGPRLGARRPVARRDQAGFVGHDDSLHAVANAELGQDALDVRLDGGLAEDEFLGDLAVRQ